MKDGNSDDRYLWCVWIQYPHKFDLSFECLSLVFVSKFCCALVSSDLFSDFEIYGCSTCTCRILSLTKVIVISPPISVHTFQLKEFLFIAVLYDNYVGKIGRSQLFARFKRASVPLTSVAFYLYSII